VLTRAEVKDSIRRRVLTWTSPAALSGSTPDAVPIRPAVPGDRLLVRPVFILSSIRSGSTLVRLMLNAHSAIHAPHELHLSSVKVQLSGRHVAVAMDEIGLDAESLQFLLWDRLLHRELTRAGKTMLVNKTPNDAFIWRRIVACWPDARFIFLLRHPAAITDSWQRARKQWSRDEVAADLLEYMVAVESARVEHGGLTIRYEDVTSDPEGQMRRICEFVGVGWEPAMLDYAGANQGQFRAGLGDWSARIRSGKIEPVRRLPSADEIPAALVGISRQWGYLQSGE
jgi:hypothetical protein